MANAHTEKKSGPIRTSATLPDGSTGSYSNSGWSPALGFGSQR